MIYEARKSRLDIPYEGWTAGAGEESLFGKLLCLCKSNHISTECRFNNVVEAELFKSCDHLSELGVGELAGDRGSNDSIYPVIAASGVALALFKNINCVYHKGLIHNGTEWALVYAGTALDAL